MAEATFEQQMAELEKVVAQLEHGGLPLEESVRLFESGMMLSKACKTRLANAESRIQVLLDAEDGGPVRMQALDVDVDDEDEDDLEAEETDE